MSTWRRVFGLAALAALMAVAPPAVAGPPGVLVTGDNLPANVDPHQIFDVPMQFYSLNTYDNLYRYQGNPPKLEPWLAQSHTVSADGLTWEFKLRTDAKFHDGSAMAADDVVYSFKRVLAIGKGPSGAFKPVLKPDNITAPDKETVRFKLETPYAPFLSAIPIVVIVNPRVVQAHETNSDWGAAWLASNAAGSGAYQFDASTYRPLERADLKRNDAHFMGWTGQSQGAQRDPDPADPGNLDPRAGAAAGLGRHDRQLSAHRSGRAHPEIKGRAHRKEHVHARFHPAHEQQEAALRQYQRAQVLRPRLQLRRLYQGDLERLRGTQPRAHAQQPLGLPPGREGL